MMNKKPPIPMAAFIGPQAGGLAGNAGGGSMCFPGTTTTPSGGTALSQGGPNSGGSTNSTSGRGKNEKQRGNSGNNAAGSRSGGFGLCGCQKAPKSHCISATGVLLLVLLYTAMGSIIFVTLEGELDDVVALETAVAASKPYPRTELANAEIRSRTVDRLWSITEDLNILYKENWTRLAAQEVQLFQDTLLRAVRQSKIYQPGVQMPQPTHKWTYASAFLYSLTLITTIGYGGVSPRTQWGRIAALIYALFGIPIVLLYLSAMGEGLSAGMRCLFRRARSKSTVSNGSSSNSGSSNSGSNSNSGGGGVNSGKLSSGNDSSGLKGSLKSSSYRGLPPHHHNHNPYNLPKAYQSHSSMAGTSSNPSVPISICVMVLVCYISSGAILFHKMQNWSVLESLYFCFTSLGTIGFGELAPTGTLTLYLAAAYILIGMAVVAMCFSLIQTEIVMWLRKFSVQDVYAAQTEDVALVSVAVTPKSS